MRNPRFTAALVLALALASLAGPALVAQTPSPSLWAELRWRSIGPHRGGRTKAVAGVPAQPNVFYIGAVNGGVWKTTDYGRTWTPIFDDQPTGSIGALAVAPSDPRVIYVGSGEGMQRPDLSVGDGIYKSTDAGRTWTHLGLRDGQQIAHIDVDPRNPDHLLVAVLGHPYGPNAERGVFASNDGGTTFTKALYRDENTGAIDLARDPQNPDTVYAVLWESRQGPWENGVFSGPGSGIHKSTDGGRTWRPLTKGLPTFAGEGLGRIGITVAPSESRRLFAIVDASKNGGLYRSDDAGDSWTLVNSDPRTVARPSDAADVRVDPTNPDIVYVPTVVTWKSTDGGRTFTGIRGAPGGDDYQRIWINPLNPDVMILTADQGAIVTTNGGATWGSWYNQSTAQFYHVSTDTAFPYRVCGGQQESGSACVSSRGSDGQITFREWHPVGVEEYGYVAPDPLDPDIVYGGKLTRYDRRTGQVQNVSPRPLRGSDYRVVRTQPVLFSPVNPKLLYFTSNVVWSTLDGGRTWKSMSPDLTRETWEVPATVGKYAATDAAKPTRRGVIYTLAPSSVDPATLWAGTDDGLVHVTRDNGVSWRNVTPPELTPWAKVSLLEASHTDANTAYAAINTLRLDDMRPHVYRTRDGGKTWTAITSGLPDDAPVNAVREDPQRKGLLFAGTERTVHVSFDDGDHWQPLRLNLPATSVRDLVVKDDDLVIGTHGRGFWILDDISPLRQLDASTTTAAVSLLKPRTAWRVRWNLNTDTPLPPDEPASRNPPDGAVVNYVLQSAATGPVTLEVLDAGGVLVRRFSSDDPPEAPVEDRNIPDYWIRPPQRLATTAGLHRFVWDLHLASPAVGEFSYPIAAVLADTPREPRGPWVAPGTYTLKLTANGQSLTQPLTVKMDPRVKTPVFAIRQQFTTAKKLYDSIQQAADVTAQAVKVRDELRALRPKANNPLVSSALDATEQKVSALIGGSGGFFGGGGGPDTLSKVRTQLAQLLEIVDEVDAPATTATTSAIADRQKSLAALVAQWTSTKTNDLAALNDLLEKAQIPKLAIP